MAIDQAILESDYPGPTLRFYGWSAPTLSLGYFQKLVDRSLHAESRELTVVRRSTGGGAIVHHHELTYSLVMPSQSQKELFELTSNMGAATGLYEAVHMSVIDALIEFGVKAKLYRDSLASDSTSSPPEEDQAFLCFQRRSEWDVTVSGYKVLGSAQRRVRGKILQHGSLLLQASNFAPQLPGVAEFGPTQTSPNKIVESILDILGTKLGIRWNAELLSSNEQELGKSIQQNCFGSLDWTGRR
jgi:lipoate-protein ligase A